MEISNSNGPCLYIVATPIGNLSDISIRATETLKQVDLIAAEDTRSTAKLLNHLKIKDKELVSYHDHNEESRSQDLVDRMKSQAISIALVSDAGTPCISDPGYRLVRLAHQHQIPVVPVPGPSALASLISSSGLPSDRVLFIGFLPGKEKALRDEISVWSRHEGSVVFYESAKRVLKSVRMIADAFPRGEFAVGRELTKVFEEIRLLPASQIMTWLSEHKNLKGELVIMFSKGRPSTDPEELKETVLEKARSVLTENPQTSHKDLVDLCSDLGMSKKSVYQLLLGFKL